MNDKIHEVFVERNVLQFLRHPAIVRLHSTFKDKNKLYFLLDKVANGTLHDLIRRRFSLNDDLVKVFAAEIIEALEYMHSMQIAHRDLKPGNILLDKNFHIVLCDFGTAKINNPEIAKRIPKKAHQNPDPKSYSSLTDTTNLLNGQSERVYSFVGTEEYVAPEILLDKPSSYSSDLWSLGVIIYQMLVGKTPFKGHNEF